MNKKFGFIIVLLLLQVITCTDEISWYDDINKAVAAAKKQKKYIMIDVYTDWCVWCKELDKKTYTHTSVISLSKKLINLKINPEKDNEGKEFLKPYKIDGFPTILFVDWEKNLIGKIGGFLEGEDFAKKTEEILSFPEKYAVLKKEHENGKIKSSEALITLLLEQEREDEAVAVIEGLRVKDKLPEKIQYYYLIAFSYLSREYYYTALTLFDFITTSFDPGDNFEDKDIFYKSAYYKGFALSSLGMTEECKEVVEKYKNVDDNPYARYFDGLLEK